MGKNEPEALAAASSSSLHIDGERLWRSLMDLARIGATSKGGVRRLALTDLDREGRDRVVGWCEDANLAVRVDRVGNIFARRAGRDASRGAVAAGSHVDTQPSGGRFYGAFGVNFVKTMLRLAGIFMSDRGDEAKARKAMNGLESIYVRSFTFRKEGEYNPADLDAVRAQFQTAAWSRMRRRPNCSA